MRSVISLFHLALIIALTYLARDNLAIIYKDISSGFLKSENHAKAHSPVGSIEVLFSPHGGATQGIIKAIDEARTSILVAAYSFTSKEIAEALLAAKKRKISVKLILDRSQAAQRYSSATFFSNTGFDFRIDKKHTLYHNKFMIIDDDTVITGSFNFTKAAENKNAENLLIIRNNRELANKYSKIFWHHWQQSISREEAIADNDTAAH